jgi:Fe-S cluster biogenesis protein NfuA
MDFSVLATSLQSTLGGQLPGIFGALGIIAIGWIAAVVVPVPGACSACSTSTGASRRAPARRWVSNPASRSACSGSSSS